MVYYPMTPWTGLTEWENIKGKPYITVSAKGIANGLSDIPNDGADFGPDTPGTQTSGIQEAINYASSYIRLVILRNDGVYTLNQPLTIPTYVRIDFSHSNIMLSSSFSSSYAIEINGQYTGLYNLALNMNNIPNVSGIQMSSSLVDNYAYLTLDNIKLYGFKQGPPYNQRGVYLVGYNSYINNLEISGNPTTGMVIGNTADLFVNNLMIINASTALQIFASEHFLMNNINLDSNGSQYATTQIMKIDTSHDIIINGLSIWFNGTDYPYSNYSGTVALQIGDSNTSYSGNNHNSDIIINGLNIVDANATYGLAIYDAIQSNIRGFIGNPPLYTNIYPVNTGINIGTNSTATIANTFIDIDTYNLSTLYSGTLPNNNNELNIKPYPSSTATGTTAGTVVMQATSFMPNYKKYIITFNGYENDTTTNQSINYPQPFDNYAVITANNTGLTISASTTGITITSPNSTATYSGIVIVEGY